MKVELYPVFDSQLMFKELNYLRETNRNSWYVVSDLTDWCEEPTYEDMSIVEFDDKCDPFLLHRLMFVEGIRMCYLSHVQEDIAFLYVTKIVGDVPLISMFSKRLD